MQEQKYKIIVLHAPSEIAGLSFTMAKALRNLGVTANSVNYVTHPFSYQTDIELDIYERKRLLRPFILLIAIIKFVIKYNTFHFHYGRSLLSKLIDLPLLKLLGKHIVVHFHGSDIRNIQYIFQTKENFEGTIKPGDKTTPLSTKKQIKKISNWSKYSDIVFVSTPDLLDIVPEAIWLPQAIDLASWKFEIKSDCENSVVTIIHIPSKRDLKGTEFVIDAIQKLSNSGYNIRFILVEGYNHTEVKKMYSQADIVIDQMLIGSYGLISIEAMAVGKPVICYLRDDVKKIYPSSLPIISATPDDLYEKLIMLVGNRELRMQLGVAGRKYVEEVHDANRIAKELIVYYSQIAQI